MKVTKVGNKCNRQEDVCTNSKKEKIQIVVAHESVYDGP